MDREIKLSKEAKCLMPSFDSLFMSIFIFFSIKNSQLVFRVAFPEASGFH